MSEPRVMSHESPEARFFAELASGTPKVQCCQACGGRFFQPKVHCPHCRSDDYQWVEMGLGGAVYSYSTVHAATGSAPYNVVLVDMDDGFRLMSTIPGVTLDAQWLGARVQARVDVQAQPPRLVFAGETSA